MSRHVLPYALLFWSAALGLAAAQYTDPNAPPPPPGQAPAASNTAVAPPPPPPPPGAGTNVVYTTQPGATTYTSYARVEPRAEFSAYIGVPNYVTEVKDYAGPGVGLSGRYGWILNNFLTVQFGGGWQINWLDLSSFGGYNRVSFDLVYFNLGLRLYAPLEGAVRPFVSANLDFNFWHREGDTGYTCGGYYYWWCYGYNKYYYEPGVSGRIGVQIKLTPTAALEVGLRVGSSFSSNFFPQSEAWLDPFLGFTGFM